MADQVLMPKMSDTMEEGIVVKWLKREGEPVRTGDVLAEIETDKAVLELEALTGGVLRKIFVPEDSKVPVGEPIAVIGAPDEDISALMVAPTASPTTSAQPVAKPAVTPSTGAHQPVSSILGAEAQEVATRDRIDASPLARRMAEEAGVDIAQVRGTGPGGRVVKQDIEALVEQQRSIALQRPATPTPGTAGPASGAPPRQAVPAPSLGSATEYEEHELSFMRKTIARRMAESKSNAPHFYVTIEIDMEQVIALRNSLNEFIDDENKISFNDMILKAVALALRRFPRMNVSYVEGKLRMHHRVHIGVAVALEEGLITPVIHDCDRKSVGEIAREVRALSERARARRLKPEEYTGGTFSVSNLGMYGVEEFGAIINPPEAAILAVGAIQTRPVVIDGQLAVGKRMKVTLSCDHRAVDGASAAQFLQLFKQLLDRPIQLML